MLLYFLDYSFENLDIRLPTSEIRELNMQFNVNLSADNSTDDWFDHEELPEHMRVCDESEIFNLENYGEI